MERIAAAIGAVEKALSEFLPDEAVGALETVRFRLWSGAAAPNGNQAEHEDRFLDVGEAARVSGLSKDALYRYPWSFKRQASPRHKVRFSSLGIQAAMRSGEITQRPKPGCPPNRTVKK